MIPKLKKVRVQVTQSPGNEYRYLTFIQTEKNRADKNLLGGVNNILGTDWGGHEDFTDNDLRGCAGLEATTPAFELFNMLL